MNAYHRNYPNDNARRIASQRSWPVSVNNSSYTNEHAGGSFKVCPSLIMITLITFTAVLVVVIIKWSRKRIHCAHQGEGIWDEHMCTQKPLCEFVNAEVNCTIYAD